MKHIFTLKSLLSASLMLLAGTLQSFAYNAVWVRADAYPTGAGKVYVTQWNPLQPDDTGDYNPDYQQTSEFKRVTNVAASTAFLDYQEGESYQFAGLARDINGDGTFGDGDEQIRRREEDGNFTAVYDPKEFGTGQSSQDQADAEAYLAEMTAPSDHVFAVFTKGDAGRVAPEFSSMTGNDWGRVVSSKLDNQPGDEVTFTALPDVKCYFLKWVDANGNEVSRANPLKVQAQGLKTYYAHFTKTEPSGIDDLQQDAAAPRRIRDLQGREVTVPRKGIYIVGRKKIIK